MKIVIIDDDQFFIEEIKQRIMNYKEKTQENLIVHDFFDPQKFLDNSINNQYDLAYIDIEMDNYNGVEIARMIKDKNPNCLIIFITHHIEYLNDAFHVKPFQYFVKPIKSNQLFDDELERAIKQYKGQSKKILLNTTVGLKAIEINDIIYFETSYKGYSVHTTKGSYYGSIKTIKDIKEELEARHFFKIQRSYIVNMFHIASIEGHFANLDNGESVSISRNILREFKSKYFRYLEYFA